MKKVATLAVMFAFFATASIAERPSGQYVGVSSKLIGEIDAAIDADKDRLIEIFKDTLLHYSWKYSLDIAL